MANNNRKEYPETSTEMEVLFANKGRRVKKSKMARKETRDVKSGMNRRFRHNTNKSLKESLDEAHEDELFFEENRNNI